MSKRLFALIAVFSIFLSAGAQTIQTVTFTPASVCAGKTVQVTITTTGSFGTGNQFTVELSDTGGNFTSPVTLGTMAALSGNVTILSGTAASANYKIRVTSSNPVVSAISAAALTVNAIPATPTVTTLADVCQGESVLASVLSNAVTSTPSGQLLWYGSASGGSGNTTAPTPDTGTPGPKKYYVADKAGDCESERAEITLNVVAKPAKPVVSNPADVCQGQTVSSSVLINALSGYTGQLLWYTGANGGTGDNTAPTPNTSATTALKFYVSQKVGNCESERAEITLNVTAAPALPVISGPIDICQGQTASSSVLTDAITNPTPGQLLWYAGATGGTGSTTAPSLSTGTAGTQKFYVSRKIGTCESERAEITVNITALPVLPTVSNLPDACQNEAVTAAMLLAKVSGTTGQLLWYTEATGGTGNSTTPAPVTTTAGLKNFYVSQKIGNCESGRAKISLNVVATPATPTVSNLPNACAGESVTAAMLLAQVTNTTGQLLWYSAASGGSGSTTTPIPETTGTGIKEFYVSQKIGNCESGRAKITLTVFAVPVPPTVSDFADVCQNESVTSQMLLARISVSVGQLVWYTAASGGTGSTTTPVPSTTSAGLKEFFVAQRVNNCESTRARISLTVKPRPAAPTVTSPLNTCFGLTPAPLLTATGTGLKWYTSPSGTGAATAPVISTATAGSVSYYVSQTVNGCEGPQATIQVNVYQTVKPTAQSTIEYCKDETPKALTATGTALKWYTTASGGTGITPAPTVSTATVGTVTYYVSQTLNNCESDRSRIDVITKAVPVAPTVVALADVCLNTTVTPSQLLNGVTTATGTLKWYTTATGGTGQTSPLTPVTSTAGLKNHYVTQTVNACESLRANITLTVKALPLAPTVVTPVEFCQQSTATPLTATAAGTNTLQWYTLQTGGTALPAAPTPTTTTVQTTAYFVSQTEKHSDLLSCEGPRSRINVVINPLPALPSVTNQVLCQTRTDENLTFKAAAGTGNSLVWYEGETGGTETATTPSVNLKTHGEYQYYVSQKTVKGCIGAREKVQIRVKRLPGLPTVTNIEYCQFADAGALTAAPETNAQINWYGQNRTGGTSSSNAPTPSTENGGTYSFYVSQTLEACEGDRAEIKVLIKTTPKPGVNTPISYCHNAEATPLTAQGQDLTWYRPTGESRKDPYMPFTGSVGDQFFYVTQTGDNGCESPKQEIKIVIKPLPSATISGTTSIDYGKTASIKIEFTSEGPWTYQLSDGTKGTTEVNPLTVQVQPTTTTTYLVTSVENSCGKGIPNGSAVVTVLVPTITTGAPNVVSLCAGKQLTVPFQQSGSFATDNVFRIQLALENNNESFKSIPTTVSGSNAVGTLPDTLKGGSYFVRIIGQSQLPPIYGSVSGVPVLVQPLPTAALTENKTILVGSSTQLPVLLTGDAPWTFTYSNSQSQFSVTTDITPYQLTVSPETTTVYTITEVANACGTGFTSGSSRVQVDPILGTEPVSSSWINARPTLVEDICIVELSEIPGAEGVSLHVLDLSGKPLRTVRMFSKISEINCSGWPSGLYLLHVTEGKKQTVIKIVKQ